jgi:hypothetical protein
LRLELLAFNFRKLIAPFDYVPYSTFAFEQELYQWMRLGDGLEPVTHVGPFTLETNDEVRNIEHQAKGLRQFVQQVSYKLHLRTIKRTR